MKNIEIDSNVHCKSSDGNDYTLCGISIQTIPDLVAEIGEAIETNKKIDCHDCLRIINYCKKLKL